ncbi:MAG TPA: glycosyltransferase family 39 protein [bacterium]|nr:glycosyltransferase family 39 protein [bacterium]
MDQDHASRPVNKTARSRADLGLAAVLFTASLFILFTYDLKAHLPAIGDAERYIHIASALQAGDWANAINYHYPPLFPAFIAAAGIFIKDLESAARLVSILATALTIFPAYFLALRVFGRRPAIIGCSILALTFFEQQVVAKAEQPAILFTYLAVLAGLSALETRKLSRFFLTGLAFGATFLVKPEALAYFLMFALITVAARAGRGRALPGAISSGTKGKEESRPEGRSRAAVVPVTLLALGYFLLTGPYLASYYRDTGRLSLNPKAHTLFIVHNFLYLENYLYKIQRDQDGYFTQAQRIYIEGDKQPPNISIAHQLWQDPGAMVHAYFLRWWRSKDIFRDYYLSGMAPVAWPLLLAFGLWPGNDPEKRRRELYLHLFALCPVLSVPLFSSYFPRFYFVMIPWFALVLGRGAERIIETAAGGVREERRGRFKNAALLGVIAVLALAAGWKLMRAAPDREFWSRIEYRRQVADKLKDMLPDGCRFMAELSAPSLAYLAGIEPQRQEAIPASTLEGMLALATERHCKYVVFYPTDFRARYPGLTRLLDPSFSMPGLKRVFRGQDPSGNTYVIYEILPVVCGSRPAH